MRHRRGVEQALTVCLYKSGSYTVQRPMHIGAAGAGADTAIQMCDDLEDVVEHPGDPGYVGNDLKEGKATVVIALAMQRADPARRRRLGALLGAADLDQAGAAEARAIIAATGAVEATVKLLKEHRDRALASLHTAPFPPRVTQLLEELALRAVQWPA